MSTSLTSPLEYAIVINTTTPPPTGEYLTYIYDSGWQPQGTNYYSRINEKSWNIRK